LQGEGYIYVYVGTGRAERKQRGDLAHSAHVLALMSHTRTHMHNFTHIHTYPHAGVLYMNECGSVGGVARVLVPHPDFRLILALDPRHGEVRVCVSVCVYVCACPCMHIHALFCICHCVILLS